MLILDGFGRLLAHDVNFRVSQVSEEATNIINNAMELGRIAWSQYDTV